MLFIYQVHSLEHANNDLEAKIRDFYERKSAVSAFDPSGFYETISKLRAQVYITSIIIICVFIGFHYHQAGVPDVTTRWQHNRLYIMYAFIML